MATTKRQQELAKEIVEQMLREGYTEFDGSACDRILGGKLKGVTGESWYSQKAAIRPLVQGRFRRDKKRAANNPSYTGASVVLNHPTRQRTHGVTHEEMVRDAYQVARQRGDHLIPDL